MSMTETASIRRTALPGVVCRSSVLLLNGEEFDITVKEAVFILGENTHDIAVLSCSSSTLTTLMASSTRR